MGAGLVAVLARYPNIDVRGPIGHHDALTRTDWDAIDIVFVDAADPTAADDQYPGVRVVRHIRQHDANRRCTIAVVTGHYMDDALRQRMHHARADFLFDREELSSESLHRFVLDPDQARRPFPKPSPDIHALGVGSSSDIDGLIMYVHDNRLGTVLSNPGTGNPEPSRRQLITHRKRMSNFGILNLNGKHASPSLPQLRKILRWATQIPKPQ